MSSLTISFVYYHNLTLYMPYSQEIPAGVSGDLWIDTLDTTPDPLYPQRVTIHFSDREKPFPPREGVGPNKRLGEYWLKYHAEPWYIDFISEQFIDGSWREYEFFVPEETQENSTFRSFWRSAGVGLTFEWRPAKEPQIGAPQPGPGYGILLLESVFIRDRADSSILNWEDELYCSATIRIPGSGLPTVTRRHPVGFLGNESVWNLRLGENQLENGKGYRLYEGKFGKQADITLSFVERDNNLIDPDNRLGVFKVQIRNEKAGPTNGLRSVFIPSIDAEVRPDPSGFASTVRLFGSNADYDLKLRAFF